MPPDDDGGDDGKLTLAEFMEGRSREASRAYCHGWFCIAASDGAHQFEPDDAIVGVQASGSSCFPEAKATVGEPHVLPDRRLFFEHATVARRSRD
jgi:hypothetical protein